MSRLLNPFKRGPFKVICALLVGGVVLCAIGIMNAHALRVTMKRVIFEGPVRTEVLTLINNSAEEQSYRLGWKKLRMTEDKSLVSMAEDEVMPGFEELKGMIRYAPRRIVLPPGASQQVRLMLRRPADLKDGEYRGHFWIEPEAEAVKFNPEDFKNADPTKSSVQIKMLTGITLPVIVRQGKLSATAKIEKARIVTEDGKQYLDYDLLREGNRSVYGDMEISCVGGGEPTILQQIRGIAVYTEVTRRTMRHALNALPDGGCGKIHIKYTADQEDQLFRGAVLAEADAAL